MKVKPPTAILLDECHATLGTRTRCKAPTLRSLLASSFHNGIGLTRAAEEREIFCPKAFAGKGQLPEELADRAIPIILQPLQAHATAHGELQDKEEWSGAGLGSDFGDANILSVAPRNLERFHLARALQQAGPLKQRLSAWAEQHRPDLEKLSPYSEEQFPPRLSPRRRDMCEPLLQLADVVGGDWPNRIRQALTAIFEGAAEFDLYPSTQLLSDVYRCFFHHGFPERISTSGLLDWLHTLPARPWDESGSLTARTLARLLVAFEIRSRLQRIGKAAPTRGYQLEDFLRPWQRHLGFRGPYPIQQSGILADLQSILATSRPKASESPSAAPGPQGNEIPARPVASSLESKNTDQKTEILNKNKPCNTVADAHALSVSEYSERAKVFQEETGSRRL